jgi:hypothetical protein
MAFRRSVGASVSPATAMVTNSRSVMLAAGDAPGAPAGAARAYVSDGTTVEHTYQAGETRHETHAKGHFKVRDIQNTGTEELHFTTVQFLDSANQPLPVPDSVRMK